MKYVNMESDFTLRMKLFDYEGAPLDILKDPTIDFRLIFHTDGSSTYEAGRVNSKLKNMKIVGDDYSAEVYFDKYELSAGLLRCKIIVDTPDEKFEDEAQRLVVNKELDIVLTGKNIDTANILVQAEAILPYIKGEKGDKGDPGPKGDPGDPLAVEIITNQEIERYWNKL